MEIRFDEDLLIGLEKLRLRENKLFKKIDKALVVFRENPRHSSLRLHKLGGAMNNRWSLSVTMNFRLIFVWTRNEVYFVDMGTHDEVYRK